MPDGPTEVDDRLRAWWGWFAVALFLLVPVDLLTTLAAVGEYGTAVETNPLMRWLLSQGLLAVTAANLLAALLAVVLFDTAVRSVRDAPAAYRDRLVAGVSLWVGLTVLAGLVLTGNNLLVVL